MSALAPQFEEMLKKIQQNAGETFDAHPDYWFHDKTYPLMLSFCSEIKKKNIIGMASKKNVKSWEYCLMDYTPSVHEAELDAYWQLCQDFCEDLVAKDDPEHSFSFFSLIVLTEHLDTALRKKLKKLQQETDYRFTYGYGWSSLRFAIVDTETRKIFTNSYGADLKNRLTGLF